MRDWRVTFTYYRGPGWWGDDVIVAAESLASALSVFETQTRERLGYARFDALAVEVIPDDPMQCKECGKVDAAVILCPYHERKTREGVE